MSDRNKKKELKNSQRDNILWSCTHAKRSAFRTVLSDFFSRHRSCFGLILILNLVLLLSLVLSLESDSIVSSILLTHSLCADCVLFFSFSSRLLLYITSTLLACGVYGLFIVWHIVRQGNNSININGKRRENKVRRKATHRYDAMFVIKPLKKLIVEKGETRKNCHVRFVISYFGWKTLLHFPHMSAHIPMR